MWSSTTEGSREGLAFLQRRVALFGLAGAGLGLIFLVFRVTIVFSVGDREELWHASMLYHLLGVLLSLSAWAACRSGSRPRGFIHAAEAVAFGGSSVAYQLMGWYIPLAARPDMIVVLALTYGLVARAAYVPSSARRTLGLGLLVGAPLVTGTWWAYLGADAATLRGAQVTLLPMSAARFAPLAATHVGAWWTLSIALATATSSVIYGLRRDVREARRLGQYTLEEKLGEGGMGVVYRARHAMLRRPTAIKLLPAERAGEQAIARFEREVQLTARLSHPNTVTIYDFGRTPEGVFYYAMELLDGASLEAVVGHAGALPPGRVLHVLDAVAGALTEAHDAGLVHRDIKPANIILCRQGGAFDVPKVVDFGLVKDLAGESVALTAASTVTGTPLYMSPEAIRTPGSLDVRSDLYALGAVGYYLLTGTHVFPGHNFVEVCGHHLHTRPQPPAERLGRAVPVDLEALVLACLEKQAARRPQTAGELQERVRACRAYGAWDRERARLWWQEHGPGLRKGTPEHPTFTRGGPAA